MRYGLIMGMTFAGGNGVQLALRELGSFMVIIKGKRGYIVIYPKHGRSEYIAYNSIYYE